MNMIEELIKSLEELQSYKTKCEFLNLDKEKMHAELLTLMQNEYDRIPFKERVEIYKKETCKMCRFNWCGLELPEDILKPQASEKNFIPGKKTCGKFKWN